MTELTVVGHRLYKRDPQEVVTKAIVEIPAKVEFQMQTRSGYYPQRDITAANIGPGIPNGDAGVPLLGPGSSTFVGLKLELLVQTPPAGALIMSVGAGFSLFGNTGGGTALLGSINNGAGTSLFGGPGAGISVFVGQYGGPSAPAPPVGEVSRPSVMAWTMRSSTPAAFAASHSATR